jgi:hypothetical protein
MRYRDEIKKENILRKISGYGKGKFHTGGPSGIAYIIMGIAPIFCLILLITIVGLDSIYGSGLYDPTKSNSLLSSLGGFLLTLPNYIPQAVKTVGPSGYMILGVMSMMVILFPIWVLQTYIRANSKGI